MNKDNKMTQFEKRMLELQEKQLEQAVITNEKLDKLQTHLEKNGFGINAMITIEHACEALNSLAGAMQQRAR